MSPRRKKTSESNNGGRGILSSGGNPSLHPCSPPFCHHSHWPSVCPPTTAIFFPQSHRTSPNVIHFPDPPPVRSIVGKKSAPVSSGKKSPPTAEENNQKKKKSERAFTEDDICGVSATKTEACAVMSAQFGGHDSENKQLLPQDGRNKGHEDGAPWTGHCCKCHVKDCNFRCQLAEKDSLFHVCIHKTRHTHNHSCSSESKDPAKVKSVNPDIKHLVETCIEKEVDRGVSLLSLKPKKVLICVLRKIHRCEECAASQVLFRRKEFEENVAIQTKGTLRQRKDAFIEERLGGHSVTSKNDVLLRVLGLFKLQLPPGYSASNDFKSPLHWVSKMITTCSFLICQMALSMTRTGTTVLIRSAPSCCSLRNALNNPSW